MAQQRTWRMLAEEGILQVRSDRHTHLPYGLQGGGPGTASQNTLNPGAGETKLRAKLTMTLRAGEVFRHRLPGAGGWGDPLARDLAAVGRDLRDGLVSIEGAARDYGVVASGDPPVVDDGASVALRARLRAERGKAPDVAWRPLHEG
jgi:N-methylhydantoinase B